MPDQIDKEELLKQLRRIIRAQKRSHLDVEVDHLAADNLLLAHIGDPTVTRIYKSIARWYA